MPMEDREDIYLAGRNPEYDAAAKRVISMKIILAWILKYCVKEFKDTDIEDIKDKYIIGTPEVATVPVMPDMTNAPGRIRGENVEDKTLTEGTTTFDIRFQARSPEGEPLGLIINVEAQQSVRLTYPLIKRALYYGSRLISSQHDIEFTHSDYQKIKKIYSIWLCMDSPTKKSGITRYMTQEILEYGAIKEEKINYDLQQIVMVYIGDDRKHIRNKFLRMLYDLFKDDQNAGVKKKNLKQKYQITLSPKAEREVDEMCNLSVGVYRRGVDEGIGIGIEQGIDQGIDIGVDRQKKKTVIHMLEKRADLDFIAAVTESSKEYIKKIAEEMHITVQ